MYLRNLPHVAFYKITYFEFSYKIVVRVIDHPENASSSFLANLLDIIPVFKMFLMKSFLITLM